MRPATATATAKRFGIALVVVSVILAAWATPSHAQWNFSAEFLYWEPVGFDHKVIIQNQDQTTFSGVGQTGKLEGTDFGFTPAFRVSAGWNPFRVTWTRLRASEDADKSCAPNFDCLAATNAIDFGSFFDTHDIKSHVRFDMVDLDFRPVLVTTGNLTTHWILGLRYVGLQQKIRQRAIDGTSFIENIDSTWTNDMFGLKIGVDGRYALPWVQGLGVEGNVAVSLLKGNLRGHINHAFQDSSADNFSWDEILRKDTIVPATDLQFKLVYTPPQMKNLDLWIGYDFLYFVNALGSIQVNNFDNTPDGSACSFNCGTPQIQQDKSVGFHGMTVGARWRF